MSWADTNIHQKKCFVRIIRLKRSKGKPIFGINEAFNALIPQKGNLAVNQINDRYFHVDIGNYNGIDFVMHIDFLVPSERAL